jgi:hypothetical protein
MELFLFEDVHAYTFCMPISPFNIMREVPLLSQQLSMTVVLELLSYYEYDVNYYG